MFESINKTKERIKPNKKPYEDAPELKIERLRDIDGEIEETIVSSDGKRFTKEQYEIFTWLSSVYDLKEFEEDFMSFFNNNGFIVKSGSTSYIPKTKELILLCLIDICEIPAEVILDELQYHISKGSHESISKCVEQRKSFNRLISSIKERIYD